MHAQFINIFKSTIQEETFTGNYRTARATRVWKTIGLLLMLQSTILTVGFLLQEKQTFTSKVVIPRWTPCIWERSVRTPNKSNFDYYKNLHWRKACYWIATFCLAFCGILLFTNIWNNLFGKELLNNLLRSNQRKRFIFWSKTYCQVRRRTVVILWWICNESKSVKNSTLKLVFNFKLWQVREKIVFHASHFYI